VERDLDFGAGLRLRKQGCGQQGDSNRQTFHSVISFLAQQRLPKSNSSLIMIRKLTKAGTPVK
jgi:hypothetical protein